MTFQVILQRMTRVCSLSQSQAYYLRVEWAERDKKGIVPNQVKLLTSNNSYNTVLPNAQQKRHRPPPDKTSGLSSDIALNPHKYKN
jgi:hypothetical protein